MEQGKGYQDIHIRNVCAEDAEFLYRLMNDPAVLERLNEVPTEREDWAGAIGEWARDEDEEDYIVLCGDAPAGWLGVNGLQGGNGCAYLKMAAFLPEYQGRGYGTFAVRAVLDGLKERGFGKVILFTDRDNEMAQACYRKCGFRIVGSLEEEMSNGKIVPRVRMETCLE